MRGIFPLHHHERESVHVENRYRFAQIEYRLNFATAGFDPFPFPLAMKLLVLNIPSANPNQRYKKPTQLQSHHFVPAKR